MQIAPRFDMHCREERNENESRVAAPACVIMRNLRCDRHEDNFAARYIYKEVCHYIRTFPPCQYSHISEVMYFRDFRERMLAIEADSHGNNT